jgi:hypothetical protein
MPRDRHGARCPPWLAGADLVVAPLLIARGRAEQGAGGDGHGAPRTGDARGRHRHPRAWGRISRSRTGRRISPRTR